MIEILNYFINFFIFLSENIIYHILLFIPIIALILLLPEEKAIEDCIQEHMHIYGFLDLFFA